MLVKSIKRSVGLLAMGYHIGTIESIKEASIASKDQQAGEYSDETPQIEVTLKTDKGSTKHWLFLKGYESFAEFTANMKPAERAKYRSGGEKGYAVHIATNTRVVSEEQTEKCMEILGNFAANAGAADGEEIELNDLVGASIGFKIGEGNNGQSRVVATYDVDYAKLQIDKQNAPVAEA